MNSSGAESHLWQKWRPLCPACHSDKLTFSAKCAVCDDCAFEIGIVNGVWQFITDERLHAFEQFLSQYRRVRIAEGRGDYDADSLLALPACSEEHPLAWQWRIRARSYYRLRRLLRARLQPATRILDLGAGNGWLSRRLQQLGHEPCAVDLSVDAADGLGSMQRLDPELPRMQADFNELPFASDHVGGVIFNASFHYCTDPLQTLREALRVLAPGGLLVILDSPIYADESSGEQMLEESQEYFENLIGERSDAIPSTGFLTWKLLRTLGEELELSWSVERPWYGLRWALRRPLAKLRRQREPATFAIAWSCKRRT